MGPQFTPAAAQVVGTQPEVPPQELDVPPPPHVAGEVQVPHWISPPQPSLAGPQLSPQSAHVFGVQLLLPPQLLALPPPPHVAGALQLPHWITPPHPSPIGPQLTASSVHVAGTHCPKPPEPLSCVRLPPPLPLSPLPPLPPSLCESEPSIPPPPPSPDPPSPNPPSGNVPPLTLEGDEPQDASNIKGTAESGKPRSADHFIVLTFAGVAEYLAARVTPSPVCDSEPSTGIL
jgi:hypothetical protein